MILKLLPTVLSIAVIGYVCPIYGQSSEKFSQEKYDLVKIVEDASKDISTGKLLKELVDKYGVSLVVNEFENLLGRNLSSWLIGVLNKNDSEKCAEDLMYSLESLRSPSGWAGKMLDSYGKPEPGILQLNLNWLGEYDQCVNVYAPPQTNITNSTAGDFHGQYCTLAVTFDFGDNKSLSINIGTCLPDSCKTSDLNQHPNRTLEWPDKDGGKKNITFRTNFSCQRTSRKLTSAAISFICLISLFILLALVGSAITVFENVAKIETIGRSVTDSGFDRKGSLVNGEPNIQSLQVDDVPDLGDRRQSRTLPALVERCKPFFNCFCVFTNGRKLLDISSGGDGQLPCLHGIRFFSLSWVTVCHTYLFCVAYLRNTGELVTLVDNWPFQIIANGFYSVDSFFLLSGFLLAFLFFEMSSKNNGKVPWLYFYVHRYIRLTPVYMIMLGFFATLSSYMASGPLWPNYDIDPNCAKYWWRNVLYINNFFNNNKMCVGWSWYLANDMQFFVISPIFLVTLWRWPKIGYSILALFLTATTISIFALTSVFDLVSGLGFVSGVPNPQDLMVGRWEEFFNKLYLKPYARIGPYLVGIALAYYLFKRRQNGKGKSSLVVLSIGWIAASAVILACQFGQYHRRMSVVESSFYNAFSRTCFASGLAWVIFVCLTGQGGFINSILSFKLFIPLSRLTYCAYLVHPIIMMGYYASLKSLLHFSHVTMVLLSLGFLALSYGVAFITSVLFESPVIRLDKLARSKFSAR